MTDLHISRVAAVLHGLRQRLQTVAGVLPAMLGDAARHKGAGAVEAGIEGDGAGFQRRCGGDDLEDRAGLVGLVHRLVAPLDLLLVGKGLSVFFAALLVFRKLHLGDLGNDGLRVVGVVIRHGGHAKDRPGIDILHDDGGPVLHGVLGQGGGQVLFDDRLDVAIQRQHQAVAVFGAGNILISVGHIGAPGVFGGDHLARGAAEGAVVVGFQSVSSLVIGIDKAQYGGGHGAVGVVAGAIRQQRYPVDIVIQGEPVGRVGGLLIHPAFDDLIKALFVGGALQDKFPIHPQQLAHTVRQQHRLFIGDIRRGKDDPPGGGGGSQHLAVGGVDGPAVGIDGGGAKLAAHGLLLVGFALHQLHLIQAADDKPKAHDNERRRHQNGAPTHFFVGKRRHTAPPF